MNESFAFSAWAEAIVDWAYLTARLALPRVDNFPFPLPSPTQFITLRTRLGYRIPPTSTDPAFVLQFEIDYPVYEYSRWGLRFGRKCRLLLAIELFDDAALDDAKTRFDTPAPGAELSGKLEVEAYLKLPTLRDLEFVRIQTGDTEGWLPLRLALKAEAEVGAGEPTWDDAAAALRIEAQVSDLLQGDLSVPGFSVPLAHLAVERLGGEILIEQGALTGTLTSVGRVLFKPRFAALDLPMAEYLGQLLDDMAPDEIEADISLDLSIRGADPSVTVRCTLTGAGIELDLFQMVQNIMRGVGAPAAAASGREAGHHKKESLGFNLSGFWLRLSRFPEMALTMRARLGPVDPLPEAYLRLSTSELQIGLGRSSPGAGDSVLRIPLRIPHISRKDMGFHGPVADAHRNPGPNGFPPDQFIWEKLSAGTETQPGGRERYDALVETFLDSIELVTGARPEGLGLITGYEEGGTWRVIVRDPPPPGLRETIPLRLAVGTVLEKRKDEGGEAFHDTGDLLVACQLHDTWHVLAARPALELKNFAFKLSLRNPRDIRIDGSAAFVVDGPLSPIRELTVTAGISADLIFFAVDAAGATTMDIPELIPGYEGGKLILGRLAFGFGYTKRSVAIAFDGGIVLPERFVNDLDTSAQIGAGIRLPVQSRLSFQFDLIPIVVGDVVIPFPIFQFNLDLRRDVSPALRDPRTCEPWWDGAQVIVKDVVRVSLKRLSYNPLLGIGCMSNSDFDGDLVLGDRHNGLSIVADNIFWAYGPDSGYALSIYPVASPPFFDNFCICLRLSGFAVHFNMERPIPSFSPMAIFELLALLADPIHYEVTPRGELASMVRVSLNDAYITLPEPVRQLFPEADSLLHKPLNITINLATYIKLIQTIAQALEQVSDATTAALSDVATHAGAAVAALTNLLNRAQTLQPASIAGVVAQMFSALPVELRKMRWRASFAGFDANAVLVLMNGQSALDALAHRSDDAAGIEPKEAVYPDMAGNPEAMRQFIPLLPSGSPRLVDALDPRENPLRGSEFDGFTPEDLMHVKAPWAEGGGAGVLLAANVNILPGQRARFIGFVRENGSFALVTQVGVRPVRVMLPGIERSIELTLNATARLSLEGRVHPRRSFATVRGVASLEWEPLPNLLRVAVQDATLTLRGDGALSVTGTGKAWIFGGLAKIVNATLHIERTLCRVSGLFIFSLEISRRYDLFLALAKVSGQIGPGERYEVQGEGSLYLFGMRFPGFHIKAADRRIEMSGRIRTGEFFPDLEGWAPRGVASFPCSLDINASGMVDLADPESPMARLEGAATLALDGLDLHLTGRGGVQVQDNTLQVFVEGNARWLRISPNASSELEWLGARAELSGSGVVLHAQTSLVFDDLPGGTLGNGDASITVPSLRLLAELQAQLVITTLPGQEVKAELTLNGKVVGALKLAEQVLPLAAARLSCTFQLPAPFHESVPIIQPIRHKILQFRGAGPVPTDAEAFGAGFNLSNILSRLDLAPAGDPTNLHYVTDVRFHESWEGKECPTGPMGGPTPPHIHVGSGDQPFQTDFTIGVPADLPQLPIPVLKVPSFDVELVLEWNPSPGRGFVLRPDVVLPPQE